MEMQIETDTGSNIIGANHHKGEAEPKEHPEKEGCTAEELELGRKAFELSRKNTRALILSLSKSNQR